MIMEKSILINVLLILLRVQIIIESIFKTNLKDITNFKA
jgi:hypothetical protein